MMKKVFGILLVIIIGISLIGCDDIDKSLPKAPNLDDVIKEVSNIFNDGNNKDNITEDLTLKTTTDILSDVDIKWISSEEDIVANDGVVSRPTGNDVIVILTLVVSKDGIDSAKIFTLNVKGLEEKDNRHIITFISNGGSDINDIAVEDGTMFKYPNNPTKEDFLFIGWYYDNELENKVEPGTFITTDLTLYAKWVVYEDIVEVVMIGSNLHWSNIAGATYEVAILGQLESIDINQFDVSKYKDNLKASSVKISTLLNSEIIATEVIYVTHEDDGNYRFAKDGDTSNLSGYYASAKDMQGEELFNELRSIVTRTMVPINYGDVRSALTVTDLKLDNPNELSLIYNNEQHTAKPIWDQGNSWNREHVWPNSKLGVISMNNSHKNQGSDLHNLRAIETKVNSTRGNQYFKQKDISDTNHLGHLLPGNGYYPSDVDIGDVARIMMYMAVRYNVLVLTNNISLLTQNISNRPDSIYSGKLEYFYDWHVTDSVSPFEIKRNDLIEGYQKNRNPFIDHPELMKPIHDYLTDIDNDIRMVN